MTGVEKKDIELLIRDKYEGTAAPAELQADLARLAAGEPLAYVNGWLPVLALKIWLDSKPLIPRPETEWWTELLIAHLKERYGNRPFRLLDLCAGSGAIGLSVLSQCPNALVSFGELIPEHVEDIRTNIRKNNLDANRADIRVGDLFAAFAAQGPTQFDIIVSNPPYIPSSRELPKSVTAHEPATALFAGADGLDLIRSIVTHSPVHLFPDGELWVECDIENAEETVDLAREHGATNAELRTDAYGRPRLVVAYF
jgi:release factor glutamine methyltransferase